MLTTPISRRNKRLNFLLPTKLQEPKKCKGWEMVISGCCTRCQAAILWKVKVHVLAEIIHLALPESDSNSYANPHWNSYRSIGNYLKAKGFWSRSTIVIIRIVIIRNPYGSEHRVARMRCSQNESPSMNQTLRVHVPQYG